MSFKKSVLTSNKGISPVVATALILVVAVVSVVGFQNWYEQYSSQIFVDVEKEISGSSGIQLESLIGDVLYVRSYDNLSLDRLSLDGIECSVDGSLDKGINQINVDSCLSDVEKTNFEVFVQADDGSMSSSYFFNDYSSSSLSSIDICNELPYNWSAVPGSSYFGTSDFCIMKYDAKFNPDGPVSRPEGDPWDGLSYTDAKSECNKLNDEYDFSGDFHLITNNQWMSAARNIELNSNNWNSSIVGEGWIPRGNSNSGSFLNGSDPLSGINYRILEFSNGQEVWDLAGNIYNYVALNKTVDNLITGNACDGTDGWYSFYENDEEEVCLFEETSLPLRKNETSLNNRSYEVGPLGNYNSNNGIGRIFSWDENERVLRRGGSWDVEDNAGIYSLRLNNSLAPDPEPYGFRCTYTP